MALGLVITSGPFPGKPCGGAEKGSLWFWGIILVAHTLILHLKFLTKTCSAYLQEQVFCPVLPPQQVTWLTLTTVQASLCILTMHTD